MAGGNTRTAKSKGRTLYGPFYIYKLLQIKFGGLFKPGFHPWDIDDRDLIRLAESEYEAAIMDGDAASAEIAAFDDERDAEPLKKVA